MSIAKPPVKRKRTRLPGPDCVWQEAIAYAVSDSRFMGILELCALYGWPEAYQSDVYTHDLRFCRENPGRELLFILRDHGSHCYLVGEKNRHARRWAADVVHYNSGEHPWNIGEVAVFYHITPSLVMQLSWQEAQELVRKAPEGVEA